MRVGVPKEIIKHEYRVGMTPAGAEAFIHSGHSVVVETGAGEGAGFTDDEYVRAGARIEADRNRLYGEAEMIIKVKEPKRDECELLQKGQIVFTYLHLAVDRVLTDRLLAKQVTAIAYETVQTDDGALPLLTPMSEIAGRLAVQQGAKYLERPYGGRGVLLGGVPGVRRGKVVIIGGGVVGTNAARIASGIGADVVLLDVSQRRLSYLSDIFGHTLQTLYCTRANLHEVLKDCDLLIGAVLVPGATTPRLVTRADLALMKPGAVIVDVAIDQGGCIETSRPTTHDDPIYLVDGVVHYGVTNMPGAVALTSTMALTNHTLQYGLELADLGFEKAVAANSALRRGVNLHDGRVTHAGVASSFGLEFSPIGNDSSQGLGGRG